MKFNRVNHNKEYDALNGTSYVGEINIEPVKIVKAFGNPEPSDGYKVSGEYVFLSEDEKAIYTLYDWKWTTLYDENNPFTPEEFWKSRDKQVLNIGGYNDRSLSHFKKWIRINSRM